MTQKTERLWGFAVFAAVLSSAGLPIYIHAPKFYADEYAVSLASLGTVLFALRLFDVVQDPLLGKLSEAVRRYRGASVAVALAIMSAGMIGLFAVSPIGPPVFWFAITLTAVFSAFSYLTICFYSQGVARAGALGDTGHVRLARWRETGGLVGVCVASVTPTALAAMGLPAFAVFSVAFAALCAVAWAMMRSEWTGEKRTEGAGFAPVLRDATSRRLLFVALVNAAPVAVSSTLFLFFVDARLGAPGAEGPLLLLFFVSAAAAAPVWGSFAERVGAKRALIYAMFLSIVSFSFAFWLGTGDTWAFAAICIGSGAALGADMTLLPAIFARRMSQISPNASEGFSLWGFVSKFTLAFAAVVLLPTLDAAGFKSGETNNPEALLVLSLLYAVLPCALKLIALAVFWKTELKED